MPTTAAAAHRPSARRTQQERSATTRGQLLDATVACLNDLGYARTTTTEIAQHAGLSRGAQLHHFPTKQELVVTAVEHLFERRHTEFLARLADLPPEADRLEAAIDLLWSTVSGPTFHAFLELLVAARTDASLESALRPFVGRFRDTVQRTFEELFGDRLPPGPLTTVAPQFAFALLEGLALGRIAAPEGDDPQRALAILKLVAQLLMPAAVPTAAR
jgi:AcrR family transcriptional regulator